MDHWTTETRTFRTFLLVAQLDPEGIRARIQQARRESGFTQQELADLIDRHKRTVENYENVRVPDWAELTKIARVLDRPVEWFLHGDQPADDEIAAMRQEIGELVTLVNAMKGTLDGLRKDVRDLGGLRPAVDALGAALRAHPAIAAEDRPPVPTTRGGRDVPS